MSKILVIQHVESEGLGIIAPLLQVSGLPVHTIKIFKGEGVPRSILGYRGLIVLGGPMSVYEQEAHPFISAEIALIESALKTDVPMLGICLGAQLLAKAAGAKVYKGGAKEIGWYKVKQTAAGAHENLTPGFPDEYTVFQWHGDTFDVPVGVVNLASSELFPNQFIKVGKSAYGVQFHLEVTDSMVAQWLELNAAEVKAAGIDPAVIMEQTPVNIPSIHRLGRLMLKRFMSLIAN